MFYIVKDTFAALWQIILACGRQARHLCALWMEKQEKDAVALLRLEHSQKLLTT